MYHLPASGPSTHTFETNIAHPYCSADCLALAKETETPAARARRLRGIEPLDFSRRQGPVEPGLGAFIRSDASVASAAAAAATATAAETTAAGARTILRL